MANEHNFGLDEAIKINGSEQPVSRRGFLKTLGVGAIGTGVIVAGGSLTMYAIQKKMDYDQNQRDLMHDRKLETITEDLENAVLTNFQRLPTSIYVEEIPYGMQSVKIRNVRAWQGGGVIFELEGGYYVMFQNYVNTDIEIKEQLEPIKSLAKNYYDDLVTRSTELYHELWQFVDRGQGQLCFPLSWKPLPEGSGESLKCSWLDSELSIAVPYYAGGFPDIKNGYIIQLPRFDLFRVITE